MIARNAIDWHTGIARNFDQKYTTSKNFRERYSIWTDIIDKYSNDKFLVLDIGCGSGVFSFYSAEKNKEVIGVDASEKMLQICFEKLDELATKNVKFINGNIESLSQHVDHKADMVICSSVLEYIDDLDASIELIKQSMNVDGVFLLSMPNKQSLYRKLEALSYKLFGRPKYYKYVKNVCTLDEMTIKLKRFGFSTMEYKYYGETTFLSAIFRKLKLPQYYHELYVSVARVLAGQTVTKK